MNCVYHAGHLHGGRFDGFKRKENEGDQRGFQKIQRKRVVQEERRHARGALPLILDIAFFGNNPVRILCVKNIKILVTCSEE